MINLNNSYSLLHIQDYIGYIIGKHGHHPLTLLFIFTSTGLTVY